jgi:hypothetical protein
MKNTRAKSLIPVKGKTLSPFATRLIAAAESLSPDTPRQEHGRTPEEGLDCLGLVIWLYEQAGVPLTYLDRPYSRLESTAHPRRATLRAVAIGTLHGPFRIVKAFDHHYWRDGDVVLISEPTMHLGVVANGNIYHFTDRLHVTPSDRLSPRVDKGSILRHRAVNP